MLDQFRSQIFLVALTACVTLSACSKPIQVEGEVFLARSGQNSPSPLRGVQVYLFTEKQHQSLIDELDDWREQMMYNARPPNFQMLDAERNEIFREYQNPDGSGVHRENVSQEVWDRLQHLVAILEKGDSSYWLGKFPAHFEPCGVLVDFNELTENATSVVSDSTGRFQVSLRTGKKYWVWCSGTTTSDVGAFSTRPWLFQFIPNGSKLVLSEVNRLSETPE
jgi:hypothetical protein